MTTHREADVPLAARILQLFAGVGTRSVFGLPGVHNLAFWRAAEASDAVIVGVRHEQAAVYAADGLARATGGLGAALTTTGPGAANAVGAFGEAAASGTPVVLVASEVSSTLARPGMLRGLLHESRDQAGLFEPVAKAVLRPRTASAAVEAMAEAVHIALSWPRGPVYLDIPTNLLNEPAPPAVPATTMRRAPEVEQIAAAARLIDAADRVVLWAGGGVTQSGAEDALGRLAERIQSPTIATYSARGVLPASHPLMVGIPPHEPETERLLGDADLLIGVGTRFDGMMTRNWTMPRPPRLLTVNCDAADLRGNYEPDVAVLADAKLALEALARAVRQRPASPADELEDLQRAAWQRLRREPASAPACRFLDAINAAVDRNHATVIADMAIPGYWIAGYGRIDRSRQLQYPIGWGTLGYALPAAIGPGVLRRDPVLAVCGDGGFMFAVGELATLAQEALPVTVLVVDDGGYGMLRYDQDHAGDPRRGVDLRRPDFARLADAFGIGSTSVPAGGTELSQVLDDALSRREPHLVVLEERLTPPRTTSPRWHEQ